MKKQRLKERLKNIKMNKNDKKIVMASIVYTNKRDILCSYKMSEHDTFYSNTFLNADVLKYKYELDSFILGGTANAMYGLNVYALANVSKKHNLCVFGTCMFDDNSRGLYCIKDGDIHTVEFDGNIGHRINITLQCLSEYNLILATESMGSNNNDHIETVVNNVISDLKNGIPFKNRKALDNIIMHSLKKFKLNRHLQHMLIMFEFYQGCSNIEQTINRIIADGDFNIRERYPWIDAVAIELQNYEEEFKYMSERMHYWSDYFNQKQSV